MTQEPIISSVHKLSKRKFFLMTLLGLVLCLFLVVWSVNKSFQAWSTFEEIQNVRKKAEEVRKKAAEAQTILSSREYLKSQAIVDKALPDRKPFLQLLSNLDRVGKATGVNITNITLSPGTLASESAYMDGDNLGDYEEIDLSFQVTSTFDAFSNFMRTLEQVVPFTTIVKFSISETAQKNYVGFASDELKTPTTSGQLISVTIDTLTYYYPALADKVGAIKPLAQNQTEVLNEIDRLQAVDLPEQTEITGGGSQDLFGVAGYKEIIQSFR